MLLAQEEDEITRGVNSYRVATDGARKHLLLGGTMRSQAEILQLRVGAPESHKYFTPAGGIPSRKPSSNFSSHSGHLTRLCIRGWCIVGFIAARGHDLRDVCHTQLWNRPNVTCNPGLK